MSMIDHDDQDAMRERAARQRAEAAQKAQQAPLRVPEDPLLRWFAYAHLPDKLQAVSRIYHDAAHATVAAVPASAERTVALRKLLEAKDAAVRAAIA